MYQSSLRVTPLACGKVEEQGERGVAGGGGAEGLLAAAEAKAKQRKTRRMMKQRKWAR